MEVAYQYTKERSEFGKQCKFADCEAQVLDSFPPTKEYDKQYELQNPITTEMDTIANFSETEVNTERVVVKNASMSHSEGGWPKDVDFNEQSDVRRFRKRAEKDEEFKNAMQFLGPLAMNCMQQNNSVNVYEAYFDGVQVDQSSEPPSAKGVAVFRDPNVVARTATCIDWHPDSSSNGRIAVSYSILNFQDKRFVDNKMSKSSYIWDIRNSNAPEVELLPPSPLCCLRFNPKSSDTLVGGSYNGLITYYDLRKPNSPTGQCIPHERSLIENSHHDPIADVFWVSSKTGHQCASVSTDGQMMWWDTRHLGKPIDSLTLATSDNGGEGVTLGGSCLEYNQEAGPTKYLVGTEQGMALSVNLRNRKAKNNGVSIYDNGPGKHHGPIYSIQRNPFFTKYFMTVGDWTTRIWAEDIKTPILTTRYNGNYLTKGCWSPTRPGVFFVTRMDGVVDVWDFFHRQNEVAYSHKIGDTALSSISVQGTSQGGGKLVATGDVNGTVSLLAVCDSLAQQQPHEKPTVNKMFEQETKREKNLGIRERDIRRAITLEKEKARKEKEVADSKDQNEEQMEALLKNMDAEFLAMITDENEDDN